MPARKKSILVYMQSGKLLIFLLAMGLLFGTVFVAYAASPDLTRAQSSEELEGIVPDDEEEYLDGNEEEDGGEVIDTVEGETVPIGELDSLYSVLQCWNPDSGNLLESRDPWITGEEEPSTSWPTFSGFTTSGVGGGASDSDRFGGSQPYRNGLRPLGEFGQRNANTDSADENTQELDCATAEDDRFLGPPEPRYFMGAAHNPSWTSGWRPNNKRDLPDRLKNQGYRSWEKWIRAMGLGYMSQTEFRRNFLHDPFYMRQSIRMKTGSAALALFGEWNSCRHDIENSAVLSQLWAQSRQAIAGVDFPMSYEGFRNSQGIPLYSLSATWAPRYNPEGQYISNCRPGLDSELLEWAPDVSAKCAQAYPNDPIKQSACESYYIREDGARTSRNRGVADGGYINDRRHSAMIQQAVVFRAGSACSGSPGNRAACYRRESAEKRTSRCGQRMPGGNWKYRIIWRNQNCPRDFRDLNPNKEDWIDVPGFQYRQPRVQRTRLGNALITVVDREDPVIESVAYGGVVANQDFPGANNPVYHIARKDETPWLRFAASDAGGGLHRMTISRNDSEEEAGRSFAAPKLLSPPLLAFDPPVYYPPEFRYPNQPVVAAPGGWLGADVFEYQWERCQETDASLCSDRGSPSRLNFFWPTQADSDAGRLRVRVRAGKRDPVDPGRILWSHGTNSSSWPASDVSAVFQDPSRQGFWGVGGFTRRSTVFGVPRVGQTVGVFVHESYRNLYLCDSYTVSKPSDCNLLRANIPVAGTTIKLSDDMVGKWMVMGDNNSLASLVTDVESGRGAIKVRGLFPSLIGALIPADHAGVRGLKIDNQADQPIPADSGILPRYSQREELCQSDRAAGILINRNSFFYSSNNPDFKSNIPQEYATSTQPCQTSIASEPFALDGNSDYEPSAGLWSEGLNLNQMSISDFCSRNYGLCYARETAVDLRGIVIDTAEPVFSTSALGAGLLSEELSEEEIMQKCKDPVWLSEQGWQNWPAGEEDPRCTAGVECKVPSGENGWHTDDPECRFQVIDKFKTCAVRDNSRKDFAYGDVGCSDRRKRAQASLLGSVSWRLLPGGENREVAEIRDGRAVRLTDLPQGRPRVSARARDRAGQVAETEYEDFVKIDTENPLPLLVSEGPAEIEPDGYESLRYREDGSLEKVEPDSPRSFQVPRPPDETNDDVPSANPEEAEDCVLCWRVEGLEESAGTPGTFDYDHEGEMQCQLVYGGSGRTPEGEPADWVDPAWPLDMSATEKAGGNAGPGEEVPDLGSSLYAPIVAESTDWNCAPEGHDGDEVLVAPFTMAGRPDGHYLFRVRHKDRAGLVSSWSGRPFIYDTTPPEPGTIVSTFSDERTPRESATRQWLFSWGWDLLARGGNAGSYCFVAEINSERLLRRSGWGCGPTSNPDRRPEGVRPLQFRKVLPGERALLAQAQGLDRPDPLQTPMPFPGVRDEGRGTLAGLPDGSYKIGVWQRDKLGAFRSLEDICEEEVTTQTVAAEAEYFTAPACIGFTKITDGIGPVQEPDVELEGSLPKESVTSRRTEAELRIRAAGALSSSQAFFPMDGSITHSTPQELYSYCQTMEENYSEYWPENLAWDMQKERVAEDMLPPICPGDQPGDTTREEYPTAIRYKGTLALNGADPGTQDLASPWAYGNFILNIFWLRPTLQDSYRPAAESAYRSEP